MLTVIVSGRNDDYGKDFRERLFRTALHNSTCLRDAGIEYEYLLAEWNPIPGVPKLSNEFVARVPHGRSVIIPPEVHQKYSLNPQMPFHEMAAKNAALRRANGELVIVTNADILFGEDIIRRIAAGGFESNSLYRAHRIDVSPELTWDEIQNPANQLASGEGFLPPPYYLGAGGDFCLASRTLWHALRGFNEEIRFSTRAKDWQFFLSAAAQGVGIEFIGNVYHLDHDGGFRNTSTTELNTERVHFGRWWDIEFGLPVTNSASWGFGGMREHSLKSDQRIVVLESKDYEVSEARNRIDRDMMPWLTAPSDTPLASAAFMLHAICAAHRHNRRLICRVHSAALLTALSGFDVVASRFGVRICSNWKWPAIAGYNVRPFQPEPKSPNDEDWIFEEAGDSVRVFEYGTDRNIEYLPKVLTICEPEFNPVLARRLLRLFLLLQDKATTPIHMAICGGGSHTRSLLAWGFPDQLKLEAIVDSSTISTLKQRQVDTVVLSSSSFESDMREACRLAEIPHVLALYADWPREMWAANLLTLPA